MKPNSLGNKIGQDRALEGIKKTAPEHKGSVLGGVGICRPWRDHGGLVIVGHIAGRYRLLGRLRSDNDQDLVFGDHLGVGLDRGFGLGFIVLNHQFHRVFLGADLDAASFFNILKPHPGGIFRAFADLGNIAGYRGVDADLDHCFAPETPGVAGKARCQAQNIMTRSPNFLMLTPPLIENLRDTGISLSRVYGAVVNAVAGWVCRPAGLRSRLFGFATACPFGSESSGRIIIAHKETPNYFSAIYTTASFFLTKILDMFLIAKQNPRLMGVVDFNEQSLK